MVDYLLMVHSKTNKKLVDTDAGGAGREEHGSGRGRNKYSEVQSLGLWIKSCRLVNYCTIRAFVKIKMVRKVVFGTLRCVHAGSVPETGFSAYGSRARSTPAIRPRTVHMSWDRGG